MSIENLYPGLVTPLPVAAGYHPFVDYRFIHPGRARWVDDEGHPHSAWGLNNPTSLHADFPAVPRGVELRAEPGIRTEPVLKATEPWEKLVWWPKAMYEDGRYRLWYEAVPPDHWDPEIGPKLAWPNPVFGGLLCYAESEDGFNWTKPKLGIGSWEGSRDTNISLGRETVGPMGLHGASPFIDPEAEPEARYKLFWYGDATREVVEAVRRERPDAVDPRTTDGSHERAMYVGMSPDGIHWTVQDEPAVVFSSDTLQVVEWDALRKQYVWYGRGWSWGRRTITRTETIDFSRWTLPQDVLTASPTAPEQTDLYTNGKTRYPGDPTTHLMFPTLYDRATDQTSIGMATSVDGVAWSWTPGNPVLPVGPPGSVDGGSMFVGIGLVPLPGDRVGLPYGGYSYPHKFPANLADSGICWCTWTRGRLAGVHAQTEGEFWTPPVGLAGGGLRVNCRVQPGGSLRVGVVGEDWSEVPGLSVANCQPITGDQLDATVTWTGGARPPVDQPVSLRFSLRTASVFGFEVLPNG